MVIANLPVYPWYGLVAGRDLEQGDVLLNCPVFLIPAEAARDPGSHPVTVQRQHVIVLTQSCDLALRADGRCAVEDVLLVPIYTKPELSGHKTYGKAQGWEEARKGRHAGYHVLNRCEIPGHELDFLLVDLRRLFTLSVELVRELAAAQGSRVRLLPPYREHLSQAFARFFMRVGLPVDIAPFQ
jgi:hypothetical protein